MLCYIYVDDIYSRRVTDVDEKAAVVVAAAAAEYDDEGDGYEVNRRSSSSGITKSTVYPSAPSTSNNKNGSGDSSVAWVGSAILHLEVTRKDAISRHHLEVRRKGANRCLHLRYSSSSATTPVLLT